MDCTSRFSASNRFRNHLKRASNRSWGSTSASWTLATPEIKRESIKYLRNQQEYGKIADAIGFNMWNKSIHPLERRSNCSRRCIVAGWNERMISEWGIHFHRLLDNQERYRNTDAAGRFSASNRSIHSLEWHSNHNRGPVIGKLN